MLNATDQSAALCQQVVTEGLVVDLLKYLNDPKVDLDNIKKKKHISLIVGYMVTILYNVVQVCRRKKTSRHWALTFILLTLEHLILSNNRHRLIKILICSTFTDIM